ncbi:MAG: hypothetical protein P4L41_16330 [Flavipsychrobacter sp.]|nr:hypothetical protein [Flavipsychrobacter sp.]
MKSLDLTQTGGFPLEQDWLAWMQQGLTDAVNALGGARGAGPYILTGCTLTMPGGGGLIMSTGWLWYNGQITYCVGGGYGGGALTGTQTVGMFYTPNNSNLTYTDSGAVLPSLKDGFWAFGVNADGTTTDTQFPLTNLQPYIKDANATTIAIIGGGFSGSMTYRKNWLDNTMQITGSIAVNVSAVTATGALTGPTYYSLGMLPAGYRPANTTPFSLYYRYHQAPILDDTGLDHITIINGEVSSSGYIAAGLIKAASNYTLTWNTIIPLD